MLGTLYNGSVLQRTQFARRTNGIWPSPSVVQGKRILLRVIWVRPVIPPKALIAQPSSFPPFLPVVELQICFAGQPLPPLFLAEVDRPSELRAAAAEPAHAAAQPAAPDNGSSSLSLGDQLDWTKSNMYNYVQIYGLARSRRHSGWTFQHPPDTEPQSDSRCGQGGPVFPRGM